MRLRDELASCPLFEQLPDEVLTALAGSAEVVHLSGRDTLFRQGDPGNALYIVSRGRVAAVLEGEDRAGGVTLGEMGPGSYVGEMALLANQPRTATIVAVRDSTLIRLPASAFMRAAETHAECALAVARTVVERLMDRSPVRAPVADRFRTLAVLSAGDRAVTRLGRFTDALTDAFSAVGPTTLVLPPVDDDTAGPDVDRLEADHQFVLLAAPEGDAAWRARCIRNADRLLVVVASDDYAVDPATVAAGLRAERQASLAAVDLVVWHARDEVVPGVARRWLDTGLFRRHYHVRRRPGDMPRLARLLSGQGTGIAMSGGGTRAVSFVGILQAFHEAGIELDLVAATSGGAVVAAHVAMDLPMDVVVEKAKSLATVGKLRDLGPPIAALTSGRATTRLFQRLFGELALEDTPKPYLVNCTSIRTGRMVVLDRGPLWRAVRAATSMPGVFPPVPHGDDLLVDGGLINNFPVDLIRDRCETVAGCDASRGLPITTPPSDAHVVSGWSLLRQRLNPFNRQPPPVPGILTTITKASQAAAREHRKRMDAVADLVIVPDLTGFGLFVSDSKTLDNMIRRGYEAAVAALHGVGDRATSPASALPPRTWSAAERVRPPSAFGRALMAIYDRLNRRWLWHRLPTWLGLFNLLALRIRLREKNLHDTLTPGSLRKRPPDQPLDPAVVRYRTADGSYNDLDYPDMGRAGSRFARNIPLDSARPETGRTLLSPSPREISRRLMKRDVFRPARSLNLIAAGWIQFQIHSWFNHGKDFSRMIEIPLAEDDDWFERPMRVPGTPADPTRCPLDHRLPPTFINTESHWWDGSAIYGSTQDQMDRLRTNEGGKMIIHDGQLPVDPATGLGLTGFNENWWIGLGLLHTLFTLEHNAICDRLQADYPAWHDERLFQTARLINAALMARIHTVEWTPAILDHPVLEIAMRGNWWGLAEEQIKRRFGRLGRSEVISGIPGSPADHHGAPFQLTEEFVSVYRMHPLVPDDIRIHSVRTGELLHELRLEDIILEKAPRLMAEELDLRDIWYSFGIAHPGALTLHNFPDALRDLSTPDGARVDLAAVDILRDRERGLPRYNQFRRLLHMKPVASFEELAAEPEWAGEIAEIYDGDIERVDLQVGMLAETPPDGFGFGDTAFRVFILMASRRLKSDRFFTDCFTPEYYTQVGLDWVEDNDMTSVLLRHYPALRPALAGTGNAFAPWNTIAVRPAMADTALSRTVTARAR